MKKLINTILCCLLAAVILASAACGGSKPDETTPAEQTTATPAATTGETATTEAAPTSTPDAEITTVFPPVPEFTTADVTEQTAPVTSPETAPETTPETVPETAPETTPETTPDTTPETTSGQDNPADPSEKQAYYDALFRGQDFVEKNGAGFAYEITASEGMSAVGIKTESGNVMSSVFYTPDTGYAKYLIGGESYVETRMKLEGADPVNALYKTTGTGNETTEYDLFIAPEDIQDIIADRSTLTEVKYASTGLLEKASFGFSANCDFVLVTFIETLTPDESEETTAVSEETTAAGEQSAEEFVEVTITFLFNADNGKFLGIRTEEDGLMDVLFIDGLTVSLPDIALTEATEDEVTAVLLSILFAAMGDMS